ncbi:MAG: hypothetical protein AMJ94_14090 [Deltaproteobacteria bacterium SM23_61]|nr:MAG: hypothetical protein AMJ94_14090 [Deltaproteobacteria bacterium SM23_61]
MKQTGPQLGQTSAEFFSVKGIFYRTLHFNRLLPKLHTSDDHEGCDVFPKCLVGGLRHFRALRDGGPPGPVLTNRGVE